MTGKTLEMLPGYSAIVHLSANLRPSKWYCVLCPEVFEDDTTFAEHMGNAHVQYHVKTEINVLTTKLSKSETEDEIHHRHMAFFVNDVIEECMYESGEPENQPEPDEFTQRVHYDNNEIVDGFTPVEGSWKSSIPDKILLAGEEQTDMKRKAATEDENMQLSKKSKKRWLKKLVEWSISSTDRFLHHLVVRCQL